MHGPTGPRPGAHGILEPTGLDHAIFGGVELSNLITRTELSQTDCASATHTIR